MALADHSSHLDLVSGLDDVVWQAAPEGLGAGAKMAILYGDPNQPGPFVIRLMFPSGFFVGPHVHPDTEFVTVLSGKLKLGIGADFVDSHIMMKGGFVSLTANDAHAVLAIRDTILQIQAVGPWGITYLDDADDPRLSH